MIITTWVINTFEILGIRLNSREMHDIHLNNAWYCLILTYMQVFFIHITLQVGIEDVICYLFFIASSGIQDISWKYVQYLAPF